MDLLNDSSDEDHAAALSKEEMRMDEVVRQILALYRKNKPAKEEEMRSILHKRKRGLRDVEDILEEVKKKLLPAKQPQSPPKKAGKKRKQAQHVSPSRIKGHSKPKMPKCKERRSPSKPKPQTDKSQTVTSRLFEGKSLWICPKHVSKAQMTRIVENVEKNCGTVIKNTDGVAVHSIILVVCGDVSRADLQSWLIPHAMPTVVRTVKWLTSCLSQKLLLPPNVDPYQPAKHRLLQMQQEAQDQQQHISRKKARFSSRDSEGEEEHTPQGKRDHHEPGDAGAIGSGNGAEDTISVTGSEQTQTQQQILQRFTWFRALPGTTTNKPRVCGCMETTDVVVWGEKIVNFGKHHGKPYKLVLLQDASYCKWVVNKCTSPGKDLLDFQQYVIACKESSSSVPLQCAAQRNAAGRVAEPGNNNTQYFTGKKIAKPQGKVYDSDSENEGSEDQSDLTSVASNSIHGSRNRRPPPPVPSTRSTAETASEAAGGGRGEIGEQLRRANAGVGFEACPPSSRSAAYLSGVAVPGGRGYRRVSAADLQGRSANRRLAKQYLACQTSGTARVAAAVRQRSSAANVNADIIAPLNQLAEVYGVLQSCEDEEENQWRVYTYRKVVAVLQQEGARGNRVDTYRKAIRLSRVDDKMARKIEQIGETGRLERLDALLRQPAYRARIAFSKIWGIGRERGLQLWKAGYASVADLRASLARGETCAALTRQSQVGLECYEDLQERIPRAEVYHIALTVTRAAEAEMAGVRAEACGSYRRGKQSCGDVDVLIRHPGHEGERPILRSVLARLRRWQFLTHDLTDLDGKQVSSVKDMYMGVCRLHGYHYTARVRVELRQSDSATGVGDVGAGERAGATPPAAHSTTGLELGLGVELDHRGVVVSVDPAVAQKNVQYCRKRAAGGEDERAGCFHSAPIVVGSQLVRVGGRPLGELLLGNGRGGGDAGAAGGGEPGAALAPFSMPGESGGGSGNVLDGVAGAKVGAGHGNSSGIEDVGDTAEMKATQLTALRRVLQGAVRAAVAATSSPAPTAADVGASAGGVGSDTAASASTAAPAAAFVELRFRLDDRPHRRVDIKAYPRTQFAFAILYFTGSDHFNRSMRYYAKKAFALSLSDKELCPAHYKNGVKQGNCGDPIPCDTEHAIFEYLGLEYKPPHERNCFDLEFVDEDEKQQKAGTGVDDGSAISE